MSAIPARNAQIIATEVASVSNIELSRIREIGWSCWDPIGLRGFDDDWKEGGACADEYDTYLLQVVSRLSRGEPHAAVVAYLEETETGHIGMSRSPTTTERAERTVAAVDAYLKTLPPDRWASVSG